MQVKEDSLTPLISKTQLLVGLQMLHPVARLSSQPEGLVPAFSRCGQTFRKNQGIVARIISSSCFFDHHRIFDEMSLDIHYGLEPGLPGLSFLDETPFLTDLSYTYRVNS